MSDSSGLGENSSVLDFMSMKNYPDMSLEISMLNSLGDYLLSPHWLQYICIQLSFLSNGITLVTVAWLAVNA